MKIVGTPVGYLFVATAVLCAAGEGAAQGDAAAVAAAMNGTWMVNRELSPGFGSGGPGSGPRGRRGGAPSLQMVAAQRGGGRGGGGASEGGERPSVTTTEAAAQAAVAAVQQLPAEMTITATATELGVVEPRGSSHFRIDNKSTEVEVPGGATIKVKSRWDRTTLRQEFASVQRVLKRSWSIDGNQRLVIRQKVESVAFSSKENETVYDRR